MKRIAVSLSSFVIFSLLFLGANNAFANEKPASGNTNSSTPYLLIVAKAPLPQQSKESVERELNLGRKASTIKHRLGKPARYKSARDDSRFDVWVFRSSQILKKIDPAQARNLVRRLSAISGVKITLSSDCVKCLQDHGLVEIEDKSEVHQQFDPLVATKEELEAYYNANRLKPDPNDPLTGGNK